MNQRHRRRAFKATLDHLEDRRVLSAYGTAWPDPMHLSLSFAPDGTNDAGQASALYQTLNSAGSSSAWQGAIVKAYQTWAANANISIGVKPDGGQPMGGPGAIQGDSRFGDIRIGAISQSPGVLAVTQPFSYTGGTWAGDVNFNSADILSLDGRSGTEDIYTLALHEAGHSLGLTDSTDSTSAMYDSYSGPRSGLAASDISAIQAIYGARPSGTTNNNSFYSATRISPASPDKSDYNSTGVVATDSIAPGSSQHYYSFQPRSYGTYSIDVKTAGFSSLLAKVTAYNHDHNVIGSAVATDPTSGDLVLTLSNLNTEDPYYFTVQGATSDAFGVGNYAVRVLPSGLAPTTVVTSDVYTNGFVNADNNSNDSFATAQPLAAVAGVAGFQRVGSLTSTDAVDYLKFTTPSAGPKVMTISAYSLDASTLNPAVTVYDASRNPVAAQVIRDQAGAYVVQVAAMSYGSTYYLGVTADASQAGGTTGNYGLRVAFAAVAESQTLLGTGTLTATTTGGVTTWSTQPDMSLTADPNGVVHLALTTDTGGVAQDTPVQLVIKDSTGAVVRTITAKANKTVSLQLWLGQGTYSLTISGTYAGGVPPAAVKWSLSSQQLSDPMMSFGYVAPATSKTTYPTGQQPPPPPPPLL